MPELIKVCPTCGAHDKSGNYWLHVADVDTETLKRWNDGACDTYALYRPNDLVERARHVKVGDGLLMIDCTKGGGDRTLFDITEIVSNGTSREDYAGKVYVVKMKRAEKQPSRQM